MCSMNNTELNLNTENNMKNTIELYVPHHLMEAWNMDMITGAELVYLSVKEMNNGETLAEECVKIKMTIEL